MKKDKFQTSKKEKDQAKKVKAERREVRNLKRSFFDN